MSRVEVAVWVILTSSFFLGGFWFLWKLSGGDE
jgi:hypothetical protein